MLVTVIILLALMVAESVLHHGRSWHSVIVQGKPAKQPRKRATRKPRV